jgi:hypothetical protein
MLPFSFESENRTVREILSMGGRELLQPNVLPLVLYRDNKPRDNDASFNRMAAKPRGEAATASIKAVGS